jgi:phage/plasmid-like protein (TIGR03299 family)
MADYFESGFVTREQAWHGLATVLEDNPTVEAALEAAGLNWQVEARPLTTTVPDHDQLVLDDANEIVVPTREIEIPTHRAVVRLSDGKPLGVVTKDYQVFQNAEALAVFADLVKDGTLEIETAGSLQGGRKVWILCRYAQNREVIDGDWIAPYVLIAIGHDGKLSIYLTNTPIRVVCWNTLQAAGAVDDSKADFTKECGFRIPHRGDVHQRVNEARDQIIAINTQLDITVEEYRELAKKPIGELKVRDIARHIFDADIFKARDLLARLKDNQAVRSEHMDVELRQGVAAKISELEKLLADWKPCRAEVEVVKAFHEGPGADIAGETAWGLVNAVTHYVDHTKRGSNDTRLASSWFGPGARQRQQAFEIAASL